MAEENEAHFMREAERELLLARDAVDPSIKAVHLNLASRYATQRELLARGALRRKGAEAPKGRVGNERRDGADEEAGAGDLSKQP